ncbi:MAG: hypothetical protein KGM49_00475 [Sphingomonadales bacterium]|nr:hypothetical protein [Sphingomonadales bacterium]
MTNGHVLGFLAAPDRETSLRAIALALLKVRALDGMNCEKIAQTLACSADTVRAASNEETLLSFDTAQRLEYFFPEQCGTIRELRDHLESQMSAADHRAAIEFHAAALAKIAEAA